MDELRKSIEQYNLEQRLQVETLGKGIDRSKLVKKTVTDKRGRKTTKWVRPTFDDLKKFKVTTTDDTATISNGKDFKASFPKEAFDKIRYISLGATSLVKDNNGDLWRVTGKGNFNYELNGEGKHNKNQFGGLSMGKGPDGVWKLDTGKLEGFLKGEGSKKDPDKNTSKEHVSPAMSASHLESKVGAFEVQNIKGYDAYQKAAKDLDKHDKLNGSSMEYKKANDTKQRHLIKVRKEFKQNLVNYINRKK